MNYYQERIGHIQTWMHEQKIDLTLVTSPANVMYVSGFFADPHERFMAAVIPGQGDPFLLVHALERGKAEAKGSLPVHTHSDTDQPLEILLRALTAQPDEIQTVAIEKSHVTVARFEELQAHFTKAFYRNVEERLTVMRLQKDPQEVEIMRRAAKLADEIVAFGVEQLAVGKQEFEIVQALEGFAKRQGAERMSFDTMVLAGEKSALPHGVPGTREIQQGDFVLFDLGVVVDGYCSDITRTFVMGEASPEQQAIYQAVLDANLSAIKAVKPGITAADVDKAARDVIEQANYGQFFTHRVGHGLGIDIHESPSMHGKNGQQLVSGMTFTIEPGVYVPEIGGVRIEDDVLVTDDGVEILTSYPKQLHVIPV
jgi:Xaa-Pro dipeptidase